MVTKKSISALLKIKFIQVNCREENNIDLRQAHAVLKYKPDIIFLEYPGNSIKPIVRSPKFPCAMFIKNPWVRSDEYMWANVLKLQKKKRVKVYGVDGPRDLVILANRYKYNKQNPNKTINLLWWVYIYLRERFMADKITKIIRNYKNKEKLIILIFLQSFHWNHVKFLMSKPSDYKIWKYYFGRFKGISSSNTIARKIKDSAILSFYWKKYPLFFVD